MRFTSSLPAIAGEPVCAGCAIRENCLMGSLPAEIGRRIEEMQEPVVYPRGTVLFLEGATPRGVHVLCSGLVKTYTTSREGRTVILRLVGPSEVLGLSSLMTGGCYPASAEILRPARVTFLRRALLLPILSEDKSALLATTRWLAEELRRAWDHTRLFCFSRSPQARMAQFLIRRALPNSNPAPASAPIHVQLDLTEREIAEMIGTSREAVSRTLSDLQRRNLIRMRNGGIDILSFDALSEMSTG